MPAMGYRKSSVRSRNGSAAGAARSQRSAPQGVPSRAPRRTVVTQELCVVVVAQRGGVERVGQHHGQEARRQQQRAQEVLQHCARRGARAVASARSAACGAARSRRAVERDEEREVRVAVHVKRVQPARHDSASGGRVVRACALCAPLHALLHGVAQRRHGAQVPVGQQPARAVPPSARRRGAAAAARATRAPAGRRQHHAQQQVVHQHRGGDGEQRVRKRVREPGAARASAHAQRPRAARACTHAAQ